MNTPPVFLVLCFVFCAYPVFSQLYINEFMADNASTISDDAGEYEDWIEIYNAGNTSIDLGGYYISDDLAATTTWQIPSANAALTTIPAGGFLLLWADNDPEQGVLHLDLKLSSGGEDIVLTAPDGSTIIDQLTFSAQSTNVSYGRITDGGPGFQSFLSPSPNASNENPLSNQTFSATINAIIQTVNDDAIEFGNGSGGITLDAFGMTLTEGWSNQTIGIRFSDIFIPQGATIHSAHVQFTTKNPDNSTGSSNLQIKSETSGNAALFEEVNFNISDRPQSNSTVNWEPEEWTIPDFAGLEQRTPNLAPVIQEAIDQGNWASGNALALIITGEGERSAHNYTSGFPPSIEIKAQIPVPTTALNNLYINEVAPNGTDYQDEHGNYADWVEIYNANNFPVSLGGLYLTDDTDNLTKWQISAIQNIPANGYATIWADDDPELGGFHATFKLSNQGESLALVQALNNQLVVIDSISYSEVPFKASTGRSTDAANDWIIFGAPTPLAPNANALSWIAPPVISLDHGVFETPQTLSISHEDPTATIRYTLDSSDPDQNSPIYISEISIDQTQSVRARAYKSGAAPSQIETKNYLFDASASLPVLMITTDPDNLWDDEIGIYTIGTNGISVGFCSGDTIANFWQDWERPANITLFETSGETAFSVNAGVKISGNCSRKYALKSLNFYLRSNQYGDNDIAYQLFPNRERDDYQRLRLRNSGQDYRGTMLRDGVNQRILAEVTDVEHQSMRPTLVYINGAYWGIQNFRELYSKDYFKKLGVDENEFDLLKSPRVETVIKEGDDIHYNSLYNFMAENDLSLNQNFDLVKTQFEIDNFLDYWISMLYMSNADWPSNNVQIWRPRKSSGKWRYMFMDTDITTNIYGNTSPNGDMWDRIVEVLDPTLEGWPNDNRATLPFRRIMENQAFREEFIQRSCSFMELIFNEERALGIIDAAANEIDQEIGQHIDRWFFDNPYLPDYDIWADNVSKYRDFFIDRPPYFYQQLEDNFGVEGTYELSFNYDESTHGDVFIHWKNMEIPYNYTGTYYTGLPIRVTAEAKEGYVFSHWLETGDSSAVVEFIANADAVLTPVFEKEDIVDDVDENSVASTIILYPNPAKDLLYLEAPAFVNKAGSLSIYNHLGQLIRFRNLDRFPEGAYQISVNGIPNGFYYLVLNVDGEKVSSDKFVIRR